MPTVITVPAPAETVIAQILDIVTAEVVSTQTVVITPPPSIVVVEAGPTSGSGSTGILLASSTKTTTYTLTTADELILADASGGAFNLTLPLAASVPLKVFRAKKIDASVNAITVIASGSDLIDHDTTTVLEFQDEAVTLGSTGSGYAVLSRAPVASMLSRAVVSWAQFSAG